MELTSDDPEIMQYIKDVKIPHITISFSKHGKAVKTRYLDFRPIKPFTLIGTFGGCTYDDQLIITK